MTKTNKAFNRASNDQKALNAYKTVISHMPGLDLDIRKMLIAFLDQTNGLNRDIVTSFKYAPELGQKIYDAVQLLNYGNHGGTIDDYLYGKKIQGRIYTGLFSGNPVASGNPKTFIGSAYKLYDVHDKRIKVKFPMVWYSANHLFGEDEPRGFAHVITVKELQNAKNVKLTRNLVRNELSTWDRIVRDNGYFGLDI